MTSYPTFQRQCGIALNERRKRSSSGNAAHASCAGRFSGSSCSRLRRLRYLLLKEERYPVTIAVGKHLFPSRTQQLSPPAPMVLPWQRGGRVGRCRVFLFFVCTRRRRALAHPPSRGSEMASTNHRAVSLHTPVRCDGFPARGNAAAAASIHIPGLCVRCPLLGNVVACAGATLADVV